ncbi:glucan biosynthesis protein [Acuticoccus sp.]|uniref:glucan biosynthesis protein n=1 Tax=Acuticoccus sp. TaxID=1904378 RepID=UPI003B521FE4
MISRRSMLAALVAAGVPIGRLPLLAAEGPNGSPVRPFDFDGLMAKAQAAAREPHRPAPLVAPAVLDRIDYDAHWKIRFRPEAAPLIGATPMQLFHLGRYAREPVRVHVIEGGVAQGLPYSPSLFAMPVDSPARLLGQDAGFAGLRLMRRGNGPDWLSFLGASYFRCDGPDGQYGLSARGLAVDTALPWPEEFPRFSEFIVGPGEREGEDVVVYARLTSPSVEGAYRIGASLLPQGPQRCEVAARLYFREGVERLGVAPLTSMFWFSETNRPEASDWRPEVHDSDGLAMHTGVGERIWRPLRNPDEPVLTSFLDDGPRGFGLIQRDRDFSSYQDDGVFYHRRPSAWITPRSYWGEGAVQLFEIPTQDETFDNIVAFWTPKLQPAAGATLAYDYAIDWQERDPAPSSLGRAVATRRGDGGIPGQPAPSDRTKYVIDFEGGALAGIEDGVELSVEARDGALFQPSVHAVVGTNRWRAIFDLSAEPQARVELRAFLHRRGDALTETWTMLAQA